MAFHHIRTEIGRAFHRQAAVYDQYATVQKRVVDRLVSLVTHHGEGPPSRVLDVGCGTGQLLSTLRLLYPQAHLHGLDLAFNMTRCTAERLGTSACLVNGDAEYLPFGGDVFDLLVSTSTLQWLDTLGAFFSQACRVLTADGLLCVAFYGRNTLCELRECLEEAVDLRGVTHEGYVSRLHNFMDGTDVEAALGQTDLVRPVILRDQETEYYADVYDLLRSIKKIGAGATARSGGKNGLGWKGILKETDRLYRVRYGADGRIPATYEVVYVVAHGKRAVNQEIVQAF